MTDTQGAVLITGAAKRIGRAMALALAADGWSVALHYNRSVTEAQETLKDIEDAGGKAIALEGNLGLESETVDLVRRAAQAVGHPLTALINNASAFEHDNVASVSRNSWDLHMEANLRAPFVLSQSFAMQLPDGTDGNIVNIIDVVLINSIER